MHKPIVIKDIAKLAGVSTGTVDRVIHNRGKVSDHARQKVLNALQKSDYKPNFIARNLGSNKTHLIAALIPYSEIDEYWYQCQKGINQAANDWDHFNVTIEPFYFDQYDKTSFEKAANAVLTSNPDGVLVAPLFHFEALPFFDIFNKQGIPFVLFNTEIQNISPLSFIGQNSYQSGRLAAELLYLNVISKNLVTFAVLHIDEDLENSIHLIDKEKGFRQYFEQIDHVQIITISMISAQKETFNETLQNLFANKELKGIFISTSKAYEIASFIDSFRKEKIRLVGYDLLSKNLFFLKRGTIDFLIHQNPKRQAFQGISTLANYLIFNKEAKEKNFFPLEVITRENLTSYLNSDSL